MKRASITLLILLVAYASGAQLKGVNIWTDGRLELVVATGGMDVILTGRGELSGIECAGDVDYRREGRTGSIGDVELRFNGFNAVESIGNIEFGYNLGGGYLTYIGDIRIKYNMAAQPVSIGEGITFSYSMTGLLKSVNGQEYNYNFNGYMKSGRRRFEVGGITVNIREGMVVSSSE